MRTQHWLSRTIASLVIVLFATCVIADDKQPAEKSKPKKLEPAKCGAVKQLHVLDGIYLAGQPSKDDLKLFKERGVKSVLNLRTKEELDWDEVATLKELNLEYHHIPIASPGALSDETFEKVRKLLNDRDERPLLVHCATAQRVGAVWLAHRVLDDGLTYEAALAEAKTVGLKAAPLEAKAKEYIARQKAKPSTAK